ncbi:MAG: hypothetical protein DMF91_21140 [Acidobacteria bacterium]|nr:MAG: hypothetical protein DMF91_21140 [Acidobacteriota bacterium]
MTPIALRQQHQREPRSSIAVPAPIVSVAICTYNSLRFIDETLQSVFAQTFQDFEIVLVDDGSTDGSVDFIERHHSDPRVTIVRQPHQSLRVARPSAVAHSNGEFIAFLDQDDVWLPNKLERQVAAGRASEDAALIFSDCWLIDDSGHTIGRLSDQYDFSATSNCCSAGASSRIPPRSCARRLCDLSEASITTTSTSAITTSGYDSHAGTV